MASMSKINGAQTRESCRPSLSVIVPSLNEANRLPLLLADLDRWPAPIERLVIDADSSDDTAKIAQLAGAQPRRFPEANRGAQLQHGVSHAKGNWLLFLHADSRLTAQWPQIIEDLIAEPSAQQSAWFFDFRVQADGLNMRLLELAVALRSHWLQRPYGDQGLLINKNLYQQIGGYAPLPLMEDLDFVERLGCQARLRSLGLPLYTNGRRWQKLGLLRQTWRNAQLRRRWRNGESATHLAKVYFR